MTPPFPNSPRPAWYRQAQWKAAWSERNGVHYVGDDVIIDLTFPTSSYYTFARTGEFDNGVNGQTISTSDRGYFTSYQSIVGTPIYSSTHAYGDLSCEINGANEYVQWQYLSTTNEFLRLYLYATANPSAQAVISRGGAWFMSVTAAGKPRLQGTAGSVELLTSISLNQWVRIEWNPNEGTGFGEVKLFNSPDSTVATETLSDVGFDFGASNDIMQVGTPGSAWGGSTIWLDNVVARGASYPGPYDPVAKPNPVTYTVRDFYGTTVSTGTFEEGHEWFQPDAPVGGWQPGWYRVYLTGPQGPDANFNDSYGATNFCVIRSDSHFIAMPAASTPDGSDGTQDLVMKGVMGLGTSRLTVSDAENPNIPNLQSDIAITRTYWADVPDTDRPTREPWVDFPNGTSTAGQQAGVTAVVAALYPDCKYFEGPENEPTMDASTAAKMQTFANAVHAGHADAQAIGPAFVNISDLSGWDAFLAAGGGDHCDGISFHAYNAVTNGDMNLGKSTIQAFLDLLDSYGLSGKVLWQTESTGSQTPVFGAYHIRRAREALMEWLLFEQKGVPRERNNWWYDVSHGFWSVPVWIENGDGSLEPHSVLGRVLAEETWGKPFSEALDFGIPGNSIFLGNVYEGDDGTTVVLMATSFIEGATVTLTLTGAGSTVTIVDGWGNDSVVPVEVGRVEISLTEIPAYVRLPVGATVGVRSVNDWPATGIGLSSSPSATTKEINGVSYPVVADNAYMTSYFSGTGIAPTTFAEPGDPVDILWDTSQTIRRLLIWCGPCWQVSGTLMEFTVETTADGINWTPQKTVTKDTPPYFLFGTDDTGAGCFLETYWDEQWIFDVLLDEAVTASGVRLNVTGASYGGEPLSDTTYGAAFGQGNNVQGFKIQEVGVFSVGEAPATRGGGGGAPPKGLRKRKAGDGEIVYQSYIILSG